MPSQSEVGFSYSSVEAVSVLEAQRRAPVADLSAVKSIADRLHHLYGPFSTFSWRVYGNHSQALETNHTQSQTSKAELESIRHELKSLYYSYLLLVPSMRLAEQLDSFETDHTGKKTATFRDIYREARVLFPESSTK